MSASSARQPVPASRAEYLAQVAAAIWPGGAVRIGRGVPAGDENYLIVPHARQPRLILPRHGRAAAAAVAGFNPDRSPRAAAVSGMLRGALRSGAAGSFLPDRLAVTRDGMSLGDYLTKIFGPDILLSIMLGPPRANAKPIVQVLTSSGGILGYVKVGVTDLARRLIRAETQALTTLATAPRRIISIPRVVHAGQWQGMEILVLSPLLAAGRPQRKRSGELLQAAAVEVFRIAGTQHSTLRDSPYWRRLTGRLRALGERGRGFAELAERVESRAGSASIVLGSWHGDWTRTNATVRGSSVLAWDWERFEAGVPAGFDVLHYRLHQAINTERTEPAAAVRATFGAAASLLAPFAVPPVLTCALYHLELAERYLHDRQDLVGARLGRPDAWMLPALRSAVETMP